MLDVMASADRLHSAATDVTSVVC